MNNLQMRNDERLCDWTVEMNGEGTHGRMVTKILATRNLCSSVSLIPKSSSNQS